MVVLLDDETDETYPDIIGNTIRFYKQCTNMSENIEHILLQCQ